MAFSRSFKNHIWHVRLATGEVITTSANHVERAFRCGLLDARTLVRATSSPTWQLLAEAAELEPEPTPVGSPPEPTEVLSDSSVAARWTVRDEDVDPRVLRGSRVFPLSVVTGLLTLAVVIGVAFSAEAGTAPRPHTAALAAPVTMERRPAPRSGREACRALHDGGRFDRAEIKRLHEIDYAHRMQGFGNKNTRSHVVSPSIRAFSAPPIAPTGKSAASRWDPLNGDL